MSRSGARAAAHGESANSTPENSAPLSPKGLRIACQKIATVKDAIDYIEKQKAA